MFLKEATRAEKLLAKRADGDKGEMLSNLPPDIEEMRHQRAWRQHQKNTEQFGSAKKSVASR